MLTTQRPIELKAALPKVPWSRSFGILQGVSKMVGTSPNGASLLNPPNQFPLKFPRRGHSIEHESSPDPAKPGLSRVPFDLTLKVIIILVISLQPL